MPEQAGNGKNWKLVFRGDLTIDHFEWMRDQLAEALAGSDKVELELESVRQVDETLVPLICGAHRVADALGKLFSLAASETRSTVNSLAVSTGYAETYCPKRDEGCLYQEDISSTRRNCKR
jgi:ABC-type transporter Mla MlaB component